GHPDAHDPPYPPDMAAARDKVFAATKAAGLGFLEAMTTENVTAKIDEGVRISSAGRGGQEIAEIGRRHSKRTMPWEARRRDRWPASAPLSWSTWTARATSSSRTCSTL